MKQQLLIAVVAMLLSACTTKPHEKLAQDQARQQGLNPVSHAHFDASFIAPSVQLSHYKKIKVENLDMSNAKILSPRMQHGFDDPWVLNDKDRAYYQDKYASAVKANLVETGLYQLTTDTGADTLVLKGRVIEIAPLASKDDLQGRPTLMDVYSRGFGRMTVAFELYDSQTNKLVYSATDEHDLGNLWEKNDRVQNNMQIRLAFEHWLSNLRTELQAIAQPKT